MHIIDGDGGGNGIAVESLERSHKPATIAANNPIIFKTLPLGSNPNGVRHPAALQDELLLTWILSCSPGLVESPATYDWGYILADGTIRKHALHVETGSLQPESIISQALEGLRGQGEGLGVKDSWSGSRLFFGHLPDNLSKKDSPPRVSDENVSEIGIQRTVLFPLTLSSHFTLKFQ